MRGPQPWSWLIASTALGGLLVLAAALKVAAPDSSKLAYFGLRPWLPIVILLEAFVGLALLANWSPRVAAGLGAALYTVLAATSGALWFRGDLSCGCLGSFELHPGLLCALDTGAVIVLAFFAGHATPSIGGGGANGQWEVVPKAIDFPLRVVALGIVVIAVLISARTESEDFGLDFRDLTGRRLKLLERIDTSANLTEGRWLLVFVRDNCAKCDHALRQLEDATRQRELPLNIALVKIPPLNAASADTYARWEHARYDSVKPYIRTPQFVILEDAVVREASWITPELHRQSLLTRD